MKIIKLFIVSIIFIFTAQHAAAQAATNLAAEAITVKTFAVKVKGVTCKNDLISIASSVEKLKGVSTCKPDKAGPTTTFQIKFDSALVSEKEIFAEIMATPGCEDPKDRPYKIKQ